MSRTDTAQRLVGFGPSGAREKDDFYATTPNAAPTLHWLEGEPCK